MPATRLIALNSSAGPLVAVLSTTVSRRVTAREDEAGTSQGLQYKRGDDATGNLLTVGAVGTPNVTDAPQIDLCDEMPFGPHGGKIQGIPQQGSAGAQAFQAATTLFSAQSKSSATTIRVIEYP